MPTLANIEQCTGCAACSNACAHDAIKMQEDKEGFLHPVIDNSVCIHCGLCEKVCPVNHPVSLGKPSPVVYALWSEKDRAVSSSGGAFSAFARAILKRGGLIYGTTYDKTLCLHHTSTDSVEGLNAMRGSKYMQSEIGNVFQDIRRALRDKRWVLFCGTPCQVAGLRAFLGKDYETLLTLDLACHGVPSSKIFQSYLKKLSMKYASNTIRNYEFRRMNGWGFAPSFTDEHNRKKRLFGTDALYMEAFNASALFRKCCYSCPYSSIPRIGDCSIADFWGIGRYGKKFKHDVMKGGSLVLVNTSKGDAIFKDLKDVFAEQRTLQEALKENPNLHEPSPYNPQRDAIVSAFLDPNRSLENIDNEFHLVDHSLKATIKNKADKMGLFDIVKRVYNWYKANI